jgi:anti-sigma B factor antagonist
MPTPEVVAPTGEIDMLTVDELRRQLAAAADAAPEVLVVDLSEVSFIDSTGLGAVVEANARASRAGTRVAVVVPHGSAPAVTIGLAGLKGVLPTYQSREAALAG